MDQKIYKCGACQNPHVGQPCPYCQLADTTQHAAELEASLSDHQRQLAAETMRAGEYQQERDRALDLATEMRKRAKSLSKNYGRVVGELNSALADRDRLREVLRTIHRMSPTDNTPAGIVKFAASLQRMADAALNATGEAAIADEHHHGGLPDIMSVAEARRREAGKAEPDVQP